ATAVAVSQASFPDGGAGAVVLAQEGAFPDALAGSALAVARDAPILLTSPAGLDAAVRAELTRVLAKGRTVYLLGGDAALSPAVASAVQGLGYRVVRYGGVDRFATAVDIARAVGAPSRILVARGDAFPDALSAAAATGVPGAVVVLTNGPAMPSETAAYLASHPGVAAFAIGGPAARADPHATAIVGPDRFSTSTLVAARLFPQPTKAGIASGLDFPDALAAGPALARAGAPLLLSGAATLPASVSSYLAGARAGLAGVLVYGGSAAISDAVVRAVRSALA
ncbi:MAG: cell wall-binding repeat-containing protein, partial [Acidimicrobiales bacterium]